MMFWEDFLKFRKTTKDSKKLLEPHINFTQSRSLILKLMLQKKRDFKSLLLQLNHQLQELVTEKKKKKGTHVNKRALVTLQRIR
jgi:hypothetical protein